MMKRQRSLSIAVAVALAGVTATIASAEQIGLSSREIGMLGIINSMLGTFALFLPEIQRRA